MRQVTRKGLITVAAAGGMLATFSGGTAFADSSTNGVAGNGAGVLTGNNVQAPVNVPVNFCGNTVAVLGSLNSASGASCGQSTSTRTSGTAGNADGIGSGNNVEAPITAPVNVCGNGIAVLGAGNEASGDCGTRNVTPPVEEPQNPGPENPGPENPGPENPGPENPGPENPGPENPGPENPGPENPGGENPGSDNPGGGNDVTPASDVRAQSEPVTGELAHTGAGEMIGIGAPLSAGLLIGGFVLYRRASRLARR